MPSSAGRAQHQSHSPLGEALAQILEGDEGSMRGASVTNGSIPPTDLGTQTQTRSARSNGSRRTKDSRTQTTESIRTGDSVLASELSASTSARSTSTRVEKHHSSHRKGNRHIIHEKIITHETRSAGQPTSRHHTIILTDPESASRREKRRAEREAQQARRAERELKREQRQERRERREARKAHSRDLERVIAALQSHSRSRTSSRRSPVTPTTRSGTFIDEELEKLKLTLTESERDLATLRNNVRDLTERLEIESKRAAAAESQYKEYHQRLRNAEVARKKAEADASRESEESSRLKVIYETARAQQEEIQRELDALQEERDEADREAAEARTKARKFHEELLIAQAREAGRREGRREAQRERKHHRHEKEKIVERIVERVQQEQPTPRIVTQSVVYEEEEGTESRRTTPRAHTPELSEREPSPIPPPPPPIIPPLDPQRDVEPFPDLPEPPQGIQMPEVVDPAPLPPVGSSTWTNWKNKLGGKLKRSNSRTETYSQDSYLDDPGMQGGHPVYLPGDRDIPSRSQFTATDRDIPSRSQLASERDIPSRSQYAPERDIPSRSQYAPERNIPSRSQYAPERDIPSRSQYAPPERDIPSRSHYASPERDIPSRSQYASRDRSPSPEEYHPPPPAVPMTGMTGMTSMAGVGSMSGIGPMSGMTGMNGMTGMTGMTEIGGGFTTLVPGPGAGPGAGPGVGPGVGPGAGPIPGPSSLHMPPPPPHEMKASRKSAHRAKHNIPPPQPIFPPVPPTAPEAPIHPIPYNNALASPWHQKSAPIVPDGWIPEADDEGHMDIPPAHGIQPSPLLMNSELNERSQHPVIPNAPLPKTPKHRAGSQPNAPYTPMVIPDDHDYDYEDEYEEDDEIDIPIMHDMHDPHNPHNPMFDPLAVRTPAHYGRPLSVIPELSPEYQPPPIPDAPLPSARHSTRSRYSQAPYRQEQDDYSATVSVESGADASQVPRSNWRRPSSLTPTSPAPPVVQQHVQDDARTPPPPIVPSAQIPVTPISPESVPPPPRRTKTDRRRERDAEHARDQAWEREERERVRQAREQEKFQRNQQQMEQDRKMQEQRAREAYEAERQQERQRKEREREERHRQRERKDSERERKEKERELKEQERERRHQEREKNRERERAERRRRSYNPTPGAPIVPPNPVVTPSPAPETSPHESNAPISSIGRVPLSEDRQITFPMPHIVSPPAQIVGGPVIVDGPSAIVDGPSRFVGAPTGIVGGPTSIGGGPTSLGGAPTSLGGGPTSLGGGPMSLGGGPMSLSGGPTSLGSGPTSLGGGPTRIGEGPAYIGEGPSYVAKPSERIVPPIIPPPPIPDGHYTSYSPMSGPGSAGTESRRRPYSYAPATSATPITPRSQPSQPPSMKMPTPEPWNDPDNPRRRQDADEAAISAYVRAVEQARKLQAGEDDEEDEESVQRYMKAKFGGMAGNNSDDDEEESDGQLSEESESESSSEPSESTASDPRNPRDSYYRPDDAQSRASVPTIILESPSNDSNSSTVLTEVSDARMLNPEYTAQARPTGPTDRTYEDIDPMEYEINSLENEPLDLDDIPPVPGAPSFDPYPNSVASPATRHYGLPSEYVDAPRIQRYGSSASVNRPPPLAPGPDPGYNSRWAPPPPPSAGLQPPGLPDFTNFDGDLDSFKYGSNNRVPRSNPSRTSGRDSASSVSRPNVPFVPPSVIIPSRTSGRDSASSVSRPNVPFVPPSVIITPANSSQPSTQRTTTADLAPPPVPEKTPSSSHPSTPGFASRLGAGFSSLGFTRPGFMRTASGQQVPPPVNAPVTDPVPPPGPPVIPSPVPSRSTAPPTAPRAPSGMGSRPEVNRIRDTMGPTLQVPMAGSPLRPNVVASKPPPQQPKGFPLTRPASRFTDRNKNKTRAQVEAFQAIRDQQDLERQRQWNVNHPDYYGDNGDNRPPSPQGSVRSRKSRPVTVVSTSDEDDWTTGRSMRGRPT
ncbi:unnamed protein product [Rhizoctonia solani]|uniref:Uncharacterized protein n=1 Tax=Rhizoctonia solani TaxID=456999 RepID=A0A8H2W8T6_9AGAM|nr:unnamed protein product [Rhizoctonia solani]